MPPTDHVSTLGDEAGFQPVSLKATVAVQVLSGLLVAHRVAQPLLRMHRRQEG